MTDLPGALGILVAALGGVAVGIERQRSGHASGPSARFGGIRTFTLLGGTAGLAGWLTAQHLPGLAIVLAAGAVGVSAWRCSTARHHSSDWPAPR